MGIQLFISTVSAEFRAYRDSLRALLQRHNVTVHVQEDFIPTGSETLDKLDSYIKVCDAVIHLAGDMLGATPSHGALAALMAQYPDLRDRLPALDGLVDAKAAPLSYTQWEAYLAIYHRKPLIIATPEPDAPRGPTFRRDAAETDAQRRHLERLNRMGRFSEISFANADQLAARLLRSTLLDLLVKAEAPRASAPGWKARLSDPATLVVASTVALPGLAFAASLSPPWPLHLTWPTTIVVLLACAIIFLGACRRPELVARATRVSAAAAIVLGLLYFLVFSLYTFELPGSDVRLAKGFVCTADAKLIFKDKCPNLGLDELKSAEYEPTHLWTSQSITIVQAALIALWTAVFISLAVLFANIAARLRVSAARERLYASEARS